MYDYMKSRPEEGAYRGAFDESRRKLRALDPVVIEKNRVLQSCLLWPALDDSLSGR